MNISKHKIPDFSSYAMPIIRSLDKLSEEQSRIIEDFKFHEIAEKSDSQEKLVENIKKVTDDKKIIRKITKVYNEIGLLDDKHIESGWPTLSANDIVGVQPMTIPRDLIDALTKEEDDNLDQ